MIFFGYDITEYSYNIINIIAVPCEVRSLILFLNNKSRAKAVIIVLYMVLKWQ